MSEDIADRFVALDIHKLYLVAGAVNARKDIVLHPRCVSLSQFPDWAAKHLKSSDAVVIEAAWAAVRSSSYWQAEFDALARRIGKEKAIPSLCSGQAWPSRWSLYSAACPGRTVQGSSAPT